MSLFIILFNYTFLFHLNIIHCNTNVLNDNFIYKIKACNRPSSRSRRSRKRNMPRSSSVVERPGSVSRSREPTLEFGSSVALAHFRSRYRHRLRLRRRSSRHFRWSPGCDNWMQNRRVHRRRCNPAVARILKYIDVPLNLHLSAEILSEFVFVCRRNFRHG